MFDNFYTTKTEWKPHLRQEAVLTVPDSVGEVFYGGAAGGGKTDLGVVIPVVKSCKYSWYCLECSKLNYRSNECIYCTRTRSRPRMWYEHPLFKGLIIRRTIPELKKELVKRCYQYLPQTGAKYNKSDRVWTWPWGAQLFLSSAEHEEDVRKYDTEQFNYIFFEELTSFTEFQYIFMMSRCRPADEDLPSLMFSASNPGNIGHGWVRKRFVEPSKEGNKIIKQYFFNKQGKMLIEENPEHPNFGKPKVIKRIFIRALGSDNPYLLKNDPDYLTKLEALPEAEKAAKLYGDWWTFSGQVFDSFRSKKYPDEPENAIHVIQPFSIPNWWPRIIAIDWGYKAATVAYWAAISPTGRVYIYREYYVTEKDVIVWASEIGELSAGENIRKLVLDSNAWDSRGEEKTIAEQFAEHFNAALKVTKENAWVLVEGKVNSPNRLTVEKASKGRVSGKILVQEYLRWVPKPVIKEGVNIIFDQEEADKLRRFSEAAYNKYIELFKPPEIEENIPKLQIIDSATKLIECIPLCVYDEKNVEDVKEWQCTEDSVGDDPYDCLRYLLKCAHRYVSEAITEFNYRDKEQKIITQLATTNDMTAYYRRMEKLEVENKKKRTTRRVPKFYSNFKRAIRH